MYRHEKKYSENSKYSTIIEITEDWETNNRVEFRISDPDETASIILDIEEIEKIIEELTEWLNEKKSN